MCLLLVSECSSGSSSTSSKAASTAAPASPTSAASKPNIVFVLTDDLDLATYTDAQRFPKFHALMTAQGTTFTNYFVTDSLCCPSRSSILRGQYVHNHGVQGNLPPHGGFERWQRSAAMRSTIGDVVARRRLPHRRCSASTSTAIPTPSRAPTCRRAGTSWASPTRRQPVRGVQLPAQRERHARHLRHEAVGLSRRPARRGRPTSSSPARSETKPFFLYVAPYVPHQPATPAPRYANAFPGVQLRRARRRSTRPTSRQSPAGCAIDRRSPPRRSRSIDQLYRRRLQSMLGVRRHARQRSSTRLRASTAARQHLHRVHAPTTASTSGSTGCRPASRRRSTKTSTCRSWYEDRACQRARRSTHSRRTSTSPPTFAALGHAQGARFRERPVARCPASHGTTASSHARGAGRALRRHSGRAWCTEAAEGAGRAEDNAELGDDGEDE